ncbi:hypothetical protein FALBO_15313 [Fusarium albosuccineum]|uniref:Uncharacterized protein n=1 Tax=Fusarium albosuccineum TaxID=1237068 RepID=A0A8H4KUD7_9HYPO|nr:hypothetical protein FALBO_15313 [Fusarium albosuccineum]
MEEIYQKIAEFNPQRPKLSSNVVAFEITELWCNDATGVVDCHHNDAGVPDPSSWLNQPTTRPSTSSPTTTESLVLRLVWPQVNLEEHRIDWSKAAQNLILERFGLELAYAYFPSCLAGVSAFPQTVKPDRDEQAYAFCFLPKIAVLWSHSRPRQPSTRRPVTNGILLAKDEQKTLLKQLLTSGSKWQLPTASHAMFPALLVSLMLHGEIEMTQGAIKGRIQEVEARTGYTTFKTKRKHLAAGELGELSAKMSGDTTRLGSAERKSQTLAKLMEFVQRMVGPGQGTASEGDKIIKNHIQVLQERLAMQIMDREYTLKRAQIQNEALLSLISMNYSLSNYLISISTLRDAASMKTLAFVTMFFLPGSFVSALFSTDLFDWDGVEPGSIGVPSTPQFRLYWAITVPLTVVTFLLYFAWAKYSSYDRSRKREGKRWGFGRMNSMESEVQSRSPKQVLMDQGQRVRVEAYALAQKRRTVFGDKDEVS